MNQSRKKLLGIMMAPGIVASAQGEARLPAPPRKGHDMAQASQGLKRPPVLHLLCGKLGSGKSTLARQLAASHHAVLISEDLWLSKLYPDEIVTFRDYLRCSERLKAVVAGHVQDLLRSGVSVVLDFPGNTPKDRAWARHLFEAAGARHVLHCLEASDAVCMARMHKRNKERPEGSKVVSDAEFAAITAYFQPPAPGEGFTLEVHPVTGK